MATEFKSEHRVRDVQCPEDCSNKDWPAKAAKENVLTRFWRKRSRGLGVIAQCRFLRCYSIRWAEDKSRRLWSMIREPTRAPAGHVVMDPRVPNQSSRLDGEAGRKLL